MVHWGTDGLYTNRIFARGGNWIGGDSSKCGTVFIRIYIYTVYSIHVQL